MEHGGFDDVGDSNMPIEMSRQVTAQLIKICKHSMESVPPLPVSSSILNAHSPQTCEKVLSTSAMATTPRMQIQRF